MDLPCYRTLLAGTSNVYDPGASSSLPLSPWKRSLSVVDQTNLSSLRACDGTWTPRPSGATELVWTVSELDSTEAFGPALSATPWGGEQGTEPEERRRGRFGKEGRNERRWGSRGKGLERGRRVEGWRGEGLKGDEECGNAKFGRGVEENVEKMENCWIDVMKEGLKRKWKGRVEE